MADMKTSSDPDDSLVTYALGSCLGIAIYDPMSMVGGLLHVMMPSSAIDVAKAANNPFAFVDTGVPMLFKACYALGAEKKRLVVKVAGGAAIQAGNNDLFQIGKRNFTLLRKLLWKNGVLLKKHDIGGTRPRTMSLGIGTGEVTLKTDNKITPL
jgi:chemotaxis protein CheD